MSDRASGQSSATLLLVALLIVIDGIVVAAFASSTGASEATAPSVTAPAPTVPRAAPDAPSDDGWALCQTEFDGATVTPSTVAITYLDSEIDREVTPAQVGGWFGELPASAIDVFALAHKDGSRRVAFELSRAKWATWDEVAGGLSGVAVCGRVRAALLRAEIRRPLPATAATSDPRREATRHDYEFIYARRAKLYDYIQWVGTLSDVMEPKRLAQLKRWLDQPGGGR